MQTKTIILLLLLLTSKNSFAAPNVPSMVERQANLTRSKELLATLQDLLHRILQNGSLLEQQALEVPRIVEAWTKSWETLRNSIESANPGDASSLTTGLSEKLRQASDKAQIISMQTKAISGAITSALATIDQAKVPTTVHPDYSNLLAAQANQVQVLRQNLQALRGNLDFLGDRTTAVQVAMAGYLEAKARTAVARAGLANANRIIDEVNQFLAAEKITDPLLKKTRESYGEFSRAYTALRIFHALDAREQLARVSAEIEAKLQDAHIATQYRDEALSQSRAYADRATQQLNQLLGQFSKAKLLKRFAEKKSQILTPKCLNRDASLDCKTLEILTAVPAEKIEAMDEAWLRYFEFAWDVVENPVLNLKESGHDAH